MLEVGAGQAENIPTPQSDGSSYIIGGKVVSGLIERLKLTTLLGRFPERPVWAVFMFINGFLTIGLLASLALTFHVPCIFPSLGATAFLFFFTPTLPSASPRNAIIGHGIAIIVGLISLHLFHLAGTPPAAIVGISSNRVFAVAFSLALTGALMIFFKAGHPPAGSTALIVSLGIIAKPYTLIIVELAVVLMVMLAITINRTAGINYPLWEKKPEPKPEVYIWSPEKAAASGWMAAVTWATFVFVNGFIAIAILTGLAMILKLPFIFPSLGATAYLFFFSAGIPSASPRNAVCGTAVSLLCGYGSLVCFGLLTTPTIQVVGVSGSRVMAVALSLALTGAIMILLKIAHPPAAATVMIVSLGFVTTPFQMLIVEVAVVLLALQAICINRLAFIDYPLWQKR